MKAVRNILFGLCVIGAIFWYYYKDEFTIKNVIESIGDNTLLVNRETTFQVSNCLSEPFKSDIIIMNLILMKKRFIIPRVLRKYLMLYIYLKIILI